MSSSASILSRGTRFGKFWLSVLILGLVLFPGQVFNDLKAQGNLLITPRRVVFEGAKRTEELNLANTGKDTATYNVSLVHYRMKEDGAFEEIKDPDPGQLFADKYIRFFPRTVTLAPNEAQMVKMQLNKPADLIAGEYRSHVYFRAVPKQTALGDDEIAKDSTSLSVKLVPIFGITIPVILRVGELTAAVTFSDLSLEIVSDTIPRLSMTFNRSGNMSVYGDLEVNHISGAGKISQVGVIRGIAVYTPNPLRKAKLDLSNLPDVDYHSGKLQLVYTGQKDGKAVKLTEAALALK